MERWNRNITLEQEDYLLERGATEEQIDQLNIGAITGSYEGTVGDKRRFAKWSHGLKRLKGYLCLPLHNMQSEVVGMAVRHPVKKDYSKFTLDSAKASVYAFGLPTALPSIWATRTVWVVEGPFDWFPMQRIFPNVIATTTDALTWNQCLFVQRFCRTVVFCLDMDPAGRDGIEISKKRLGLAYTDEDGAHRAKSDSHLTAHTIMYPYKDPGEFYSNKGLPALRTHFLERAERLGIA